MVIASSIAYPTESTKEIVRRFLEAPAIPDFMIRRGPNIKSDLEKGIMSLSLYELDDARFAEGMRFIGKYYTIFLGVPGFRYRNFGLRSKRRSLVTRRLFPEGDQVIDRQKRSTGKGSVRRK